jgi:predicted enzyme related to lactoylglutathione lyase
MIKTKLVRHTGIVAEDIEKLKTFYTFLGFEIYAEAWESGPALVAMLGLLPNEKVQTVKMRLANGGAIELLYFPNRPIQRHKPQIYEKGITHVALQVDDLENVFQKLVSKFNIEYISKPQKTEGGAIVCFIKDPEGNYLEMVQV